MIGETIYGLNVYGNATDGFAQKAGDSSAGSGLFPTSLGSPYADTFKRDRAPSQQELLGHMVGTAYRCVSLNSNLLACSRLRLYIKRRVGEPKAKFVQAAEILGKRVTAPVNRKVLKGLREIGAMGRSALIDATEDSAEVEEVKHHPFLDLLRKPEDAVVDGGLTPYDHRWVTQALLESIGRCYWYCGDRDRFGHPKSLPMLRAQYMREIVDTANSGRYIDHYEYGTAKIETKDVVRFAMVDPSNPHLGFLSPMRSAIEKIRLVRGGDAFLNALLENGGYPAGMWSPKGDSEGGGIGTAEARRMQSSFRSAFAMSNAGRIFVSESPGALQTLAWKPAEIIDVERARELCGQIADCFDIPRTKLFRDSSNRASGESGDMDHAKDAGLSRCSRFEEAINSQLLTFFDESGSLFVAFDSPLPAERTLLLDETRTGGQLALTTLNEGREALGLEPANGPIGDCRLMPERSVLVSPDGTAFTEHTDTTDPMDLEAARAANRPKPQPPAKKPAKKKPAKRAVGTTKILAKLTEAVELLAKNGIPWSTTNVGTEAGFQPSNPHGERSGGSQSQGRMPESALPESEPLGREILHSMRMPVPAARSAVAPASQKNTQHGSEINSLLASEGYTPEEIEAAVKGHNHDLVTSL